MPEIRSRNNDVIGFHAQQAVEKSLKAALVTSGAEIPYTHDVSFMLSAVSEHGLALPGEVAQAEWLTPWAVAMRHGGGDPGLDRPAAVAAAKAAVLWTRDIVEHGPKKTSP